MAKCRRLYICRKNKERNNERAFGKSGRKKRLRGRNLSSRLSEGKQKRVKLWFDHFWLLVFMCWHALCVLSENLLLVSGVGEEKSEKMVFHLSLFKQTQCFVSLQCWFAGFAISMSSTRKCETSGGVVGLEHNIWWWVVRLFRLQAARETTRGIIQLNRNLLDFSFPTSNNVKGLHTCTLFTICVHICVFGLCEETHAGSQRTCNLHTDWPQPGSRPGFFFSLVPMLTPTGQQPSIWNV